MRLQEIYINFPFFMKVKSLKHPKHNSDHFCTPKGELNRCNEFNMPMESQCPQRTRCSKNERHFGKQRVKQRAPIFLKI